jgi:hypothetical protein
MKGPFPLVLASVFFLTGILLACGCTGVPVSSGEGNGTKAAPVPPIVGSWLSPPRDPGGIRDLYLFKDSGRADATVVPGTPGETLSYEVYLQATWRETSGDRYLLAGEEITHHFTNDSHTTRMVRDLLRYDARDDRLYRESDPGHPLERISHEAVIPPGMNVSIPWD